MPGRTSPRGCARKLNGTLKGQVKLNRKGSVHRLKGWNSSMEQGFTDLDALVREEKRLTAVENHSEAWAEGLSAGIEPEIIAEAALTTALAELLRDQRRAGRARADRAHARPGRRRGIRAGSVAALTPASGRSLIERSGLDSSERHRRKRCSSMTPRQKRRTASGQAALVWLAASCLCGPASFSLLPVPPRRSPRSAARSCRLRRPRHPARTRHARHPHPRRHGATARSAAAVAAGRGRDPEDLDGEARRAERHRPAGDRRERPAARDRLQPRPACRSRSGGCTT